MHGILQLLGHACMHAMYASNTEGLTWHNCFAAVCVLCVRCAFQNGCTPLHIAAWHNKLEAVRLLLHHGADKNARNKVCRPCAAAVGMYIACANVRWAGGERKRRRRGRPASACRQDHDTMRTSHIACMHAWASRIALVATGGFHTCMCNGSVLFSVLSLSSVCCRTMRRLSTVFAPIQSSPLLAVR